MEHRSPEVQSQVARLAYALGHCNAAARIAHCPKLADAVYGLHLVLVSTAHELRPGDGRAIRHALQGYEAIFVDLELCAGRDDLQELRNHLGVAHREAEDLAMLLDTPLDFPADALPRKAKP